MFMSALSVIVALGATPGYISVDAVVPTEHQTYCWNKYNANAKAGMNIEDIKKENDKDCADVFDIEVKHIGNSKVYTFKPVKQPNGQ